MATRCSCSFISPLSAFSSVLHSGRSFPIGAPAPGGGGGMSGFSLPDGRGLGPRPSAREMVGNAGPEKKLKVN